ncbi:MAG: FAD/NAD(P)-binding protein [bacterium]
MNNLYRPKPATIRKIVIENEAKDIKTFELVFSTPEDRKSLDFTSGQFAMLSVLGAGESPIGIASSPLDDEYLQFTVKRYPTGVVTTALHNLEEGTEIGVRGPYGNFYPLQTMDGKNILIVGGGFAVTTLRSTIRYLLHEKNRSRFKDITLLYGARNPGELIYKSELKQWQERDDINVYLTVDRGDENWKGRVGLVPNVLKELAPSSENGITLVCGPPIMLKYTMLPLLDLGFSPERIFTSLERRMSCGIGKCGRCNIGSKYVCKDGPVFTYGGLRELPEGAP